MENTHEDQFTTQNLSHLGILAGTLRKINFIERIDKVLPIAKEKGVKATQGERIAAMVFNALGFIDSRLYMFSEFLKCKPVKRLLGSHLKAEYFTDDALGRCLDKIFDYGPTQFVSDITFQIASQLDLLGKSIHIDSTSLTLYGDYKENEPKAPKITYGYSKDKRSNLKQLILNLAVANKANLPIFMASHSGNASDQKILIQAAEHIEQCCKKLANIPSHIYVADSAMYESCLKQADNLLWLSRVPMRRKEAKQFVQNKTSYQWQAIPNTAYKVHAEEKTIAGVKQRWVLVHSGQAQEREKGILAYKKSQERKEIERKLWHLSNKTYNCQEDAHKAIKELQKQLKYHYIVNVDIRPLQGYQGRGKPKKGAEKCTLGYRIKTALAEDSKKIEAVLTQKSHFILATNELDEKSLSNQEELLEYKGQQKIERGFAFIKDNTFEVSSVFLKKPSRISALMAIMVLSLFIYSLTQYLLRQTLQEKGESIPNQLKKPTQKPTAKWVYFLFRNIQVLYIQISEGYHQEVVVNLNPLLERIITYFGSDTMAIYDITLPKAN